MFLDMLHRFWQWYERHYLLNIGIAAGLFCIQLLHLYWLTTDIVALRLVGRTVLALPESWELILALVDYTEIPAIISTSLVYINEWRQYPRAKAILFFLFLNSQWLHIFWITDEVVESQFTGVADTVLPVWLAWLAIMIDYLELPVIYDTIRKFIRALRQHQVNEFLKEEVAFHEEPGK